MTDRELFKKIQEILDTEVQVNWNQEVVNSATVAQLIMNLVVDELNDTYERALDSGVEFGQMLARS